MTSPATPALRIAEAMWSLNNRRITVVEYRATMRELRESMSDLDYNRAKLSASAMVQR